MSICGGAWEQVEEQLDNVTASIQLLEHKSYLYILKRDTGPDFRLYIDISSFHLNSFAHDLSFFKSL